MARPEVDAKKCEQIRALPGMVGPQVPCPREATKRFTWPGHPERRICDDCLPRLRSIAEACGLELEIKPLALLTSGETDLVALALGVLLVRSPDLARAVAAVAVKLGCVGEVEDFRQLNADDPRLARGDS